MSIFDAERIAKQLHDQAVKDNFRVTAHAHQEMVEEDILLDDVIDVLRGATLLENYPEHKRGACCLVVGKIISGRFLHVVCTTSLSVAVIITVYEPMAPKWVTPYQRG